jgi:hypothetical protein
MIAPSSPVRGVTAVLHLTYPSASARLQLIREHLPRLRAPWFFADIVFDHLGHVTPALEVGLLGEPADLDTWLARARQVRALQSARASPTALVLDPSLFAGAHVPPVYLDVMAESSQRAAQLLSQHVRASTSPLSDAIVAQEVLALVTGLLASPSQQHQALAWYADWLTRLADLHAEPTAPGPARVPNLPAASAAYASLGPRFRDQVRLLDLRRPGLPAQSSNARALVRNSLVASLAHIQAVRLWSPPDRPRLRYEATLIQHLYSSTCPTFGAGLS